MNNNQLVSICVPVFNGGLFLEETLNSLVNQTYKNIEIIVSDNASTDNTGEIVKSFCAKDNRVKYFRNEINLGYCKNILSAVNNAKSEYIAVYHSDDIYEPEIVEKEFDLLSNNSSISGVFVKLSEYFYNKNLLKPANYNALINSTLMNKEINAIVGDYQDFLPWILRVGNFFACPSFMTRKSVYLKLGGYLDTYPSNEDLHLWIRYLKNGHKLAIINEYLLKYRVGNEHASATWRRSTDLAVMYNVIDDMIVKKDNSIDETSLVFYKKNKSKSYLFAGYNAYIQKKNGKMQENLERSIETFKYPFMSKNGISQHFFRFACYVKYRISS